MTYQVTIQPSGRAFRAGHTESVLDAALRQGIVLPYGCRNGACGACMGAVLSGTVRYKGSDLPPALDTTQAAAHKALFCQARATSDLVIGVREVQAVEDIEVRTIPCRVSRLEYLAPDVIRVDLKLPTNQRLQFLPGQYINILLKDHNPRAFSIANAPHADEYIELHIRYVAGGVFTDQVFHQLREKALLRIRGPLGTFFLREDTRRPVILVGGGTGFAPLKAMLEHAFEIGLRQPLHLFWGARARPDLYLDGLPRYWRQWHQNFRYTPVLSDPAPDDHWTGETGLVTHAVVNHYADLAPCDVYASGPPAMVHAGHRLFLEHGLDESRFFSDAFEYAAATETG
jgi:CDP-4-dehydro-6-deoxyglucose reductase